MSDSFRARIERIMDQWDRENYDRPTTIKDAWICLDQIREALVDDEEATERGNPDGIDRTEDGA